MDKMTKRGERVLLKAKLEALQKARSKIINRTHWTKKTWARNRDGQPCIHYSDKAVCFCAGAAIGLACGGVEARMHGLKGWAVSYTHLTLPTILLV